jgi:LmbE family N-acetylglucosaminyl deacetylase
MSEKAGEHLLNRKVKAAPKEKRQGRWLKHGLFVVLACLAVALVVYGGIWLIFRKINSDYYQTLPLMQIPQAKRVLVVAPHNDDEMLTDSVLVKRLVSQGSQVYFAIITNGDGFTPDIMLSSKKLVLVGSDYIRLGQIRQRETLNGLALLGIPPDNIRFLGYPDRGCQEMLLYHWYTKAPYFDPWTRSSVVPYENSYGDMPALAGESLFNDIKKVLDEVAPDLIVMPHPYDENVDHAAVNAMMQFALRSLGMDGVSQYLYLTHHAINTWPQSIYPRNAGPYLVPPVNLRLADTEWQVLPIAADEKQLARNIIDQYPSQLVVDNKYLHSFVRDNELFAVYKPPVLQSGQHTSDQIRPSVDNRLCVTPSGGILSRSTGDAKHIKALYGEISTDGFLHLMLEVREFVNPKIIYQMMMISESKSGAISHSTITVQNGQVYQVGIDYPIKLIQTGGAWIHLSLAFSELVDIKSCIIQASASNYERVESKTIWQELIFPAQDVLEKTIS